MYQCRCGTCETAEFFESLESAQTEFSEHAEQHHEVVLERINTPTEGNISAAITDAATPKEDSRETVSEE